MSLELADATSGRLVAQETGAFPQDGDVRPLRALDDLR